MITPNSHIWSKNINASATTLVSQYLTDDIIFSPGKGNIFKVSYNALCNGPPQKIVYKYCPNLHFDYNYTVTYKANYIPQPIKA